MPHPAVRDERSAPFFDATAAGCLLLLRCTSCGGWSAPYFFNSADPRVCPLCRQGGLEWAEGRGTGTLISWTVIHTKTPSDSAVELRHVAVVELAEGPWILSPVLSDFAQLRVGVEMVVEFSPVGGGEPIPTFRPIGGTSV